MGERGESGTFPREEEALQSFRSRVRLWRATRLQEADAQKGTSKESLQASEITRRPPSVTTPCPNSLLPRGCFYLCIGYYY